MMSSATAMLPSVTMVPKQTPKATVIWLHGLGADGYDFQPIVPQLALPADAAIKFIFPHAPEQPVTVNAGMKMRAWYDILEMSLERKVDQQGVLDSVALVRQLIEHEIAAGIPAERIILAGFSQGGVIALHTALTFAERLAGVMALSTYIALPDRLTEQVSQRDVPIFWGHGTVDPVVPYRLGEHGKHYLQELGLQVDWHKYPMQHSLCDQEIQDIRLWILQCLSIEA